MKATKPTNQNIVNNVQTYICQGIIPHPYLYLAYLTELFEQSKQNQVCMTPLGLLEYYNLKINIKIKTRIEQAEARRKTRKVA